MDFSRTVHSLLILSSRKLLSCSFTHRAWLRASSDQSLLNNVLKTKTRASLDGLWTAFDRQCIKDCKHLPDDLFDRLATIDGTTPRLLEEASEEESVGSDGSDNDDGPPPLISGSDDEIPPLEEYDSDYDRGPETFDDNDSSDEEPEPSRPARTRPPRKVPSHKPVARPVQPGPSSGLAPSRRAGVDVRNGGSQLAQDFEEEEEDEPRRREKIKTRKATVEKDGNASDATMRGASSSEWETTDSESEREGLPADFKFKVSKRVYGTFELVLGGDNVVRYVRFISSSFLIPSADPYFLLES